MKTPMMMCGHAANSTSQGAPACVICAPNPMAYQVAVPPDLSGRMARCHDDGSVRPSSTDLPFFQYRGPLSRFATTCRNCGMYEEAHGAPGSTCRCDNYEPRVEGHEFDSYYCGCRGWD